MTEPDSHHHVDEIRAGVLGALLRNMSLDYAARADGITVAQAEEIARAAGWPDDMTAVMVEHRRLTGVPTHGRPVATLIGPPGVDTRRAVEQPNQVRPRRPLGPRLDLSVARLQPGSDPLPEVDRSFPPVKRPAQDSPGTPQVSARCDIPGEDVSAVVTQAEHEYRGEVVQTGPTPEHREPLVDYLARFVGPLPGDPGYVSRPLPPEQEARLEQVMDEALAERAALLAAGPQPCEVCRVPVAAEFIANTGRPRHKWHPADAADALDFGQVSVDD